MVALEVAVLEAGVVIQAPVLRRDAAALVAQAVVTMMTMKNPRLDLLAGAVALEDVRRVAILRQAAVR